LLVKKYYLIWCEGSEFGDAEELHCEAEDDGKKKKLTLTNVTKVENQTKCVVTLYMSEFKCRIIFYYIFKI